MSAPIAYTTTRHRCPHCRRSYAHPRPAREHIARCWTNPDVQGCKTCQHRVVDYEGGDYCAVDVDLTNPADPETTMPIIHCDLWEATDAA